MKRIELTISKLSFAALLLTAGLLPLLQRLSPAAGAAGSFLLFLGTRWISSGLLFGVRIFEPGMVSTNLFAPLGIYGLGFFSADYFPVIPWYFLFLTGYFLFGVLRAGGAGGLLSRKIPLLSAAGRHTLPVYLIHQPILMGICLLIFGEI